MVLLPSINVANPFKFIRLGQYHFIERAYNLPERIRTRFHSIKQLLRRTLSHCSQSGFDGFVSRAVVHMSFDL